MWQRWLLFSLLVTCSWQMRIKRQDEDSECEWWEKDCQKIDLPNAAPIASPASAAEPPPPPPEVKNPPLKEVIETPNGRCACVPYYLCKEGDIITDGAGILDIRERPKAPKKKPGKSRRQADDLVGGHCDKSIYVCCSIPPGEAAPALLPPPETAPPPAATYTPICGQRNRDGVFVRISSFKDNEAQYGEFPWMTAILKPIPNAATGGVDDVFVCGGSLVHPQVVLTAAHCVAGKDAKSFKVRLGEWDTSKADELGPHQDVAVVDFIVHEGFYAAAVHNDFALLFLAAPVVLGGHIETICLPAPQQAIDPSQCVVTGWGKDKFGATGKYQHIMKKVDLPLVPNEVCQNALRTTRLGQYFKLHPSFICAGGIAGKDTCKGDGGSPLVCPIPGHADRYVQVGIVAWGIGCGDEIPGVYADVVGATSWIQENIAQRMSLQSDYFLKQLPA